MADANLHDFYGRIERIERDRARGYGFEAAGTLGMSYYRKQPKRRVPFWGPLLIVLVTSIGLKGAIHHQMGAATYEKRVTELAAGAGFDRLGAVLMVADPATVWVSHQIRDALN